MEKKPFPVPRFVILVEPFKAKLMSSSAVASLGNCIVHHCHLPDCLIQLYSSEIHRDTCLLLHSIETLPLQPEIDEKTYMHTFVAYKTLNAVRSSN
jgi:hypothetical protein